MLNLTTLADIMLGTVDTWDHEAIRYLNPTLPLPSAPITVAIPGLTPLINRVSQLSPRRERAFHSNGSYSFLPALRALAILTHWRTRLGGIRR